MHDLDAVAVAEGRRGVGGSRYDLQITLHGHLAGVETQYRHQGRYVTDVGEAPFFAIDQKPHHLLRGGRRALPQPALVSPAARRYKTAESAARLFQAFLVEGGA